MRRRDLLGGALAVAASGACKSSAPPASDGADYVVVGGGIYGTGIAWELSRRGASVILLEADRIAGGASGGPGKRGVRSNGRAERELDLVARATARWPGLAGEIGEAIDLFDGIGQLELIENQSDLAPASARADLQNQHGVTTRLVQGGELSAMEPGLSPSVIAALYCPGDGISDHTATTQAFARAAGRLGASVREGARVDSLASDGDRVTAAVLDDGTRIGVGRAALVFANAAVADIVRASFDVGLGVLRVLPQALITAPVSPPLPRHLVGHASRKLHMKPLPDGRVMITGGWLGTWDADAGEGVTDPSAVAGNFAQAVAVFPSLANVAIEQAFADRWESAVASMVPIVDFVPGTSNALIGCGWSGEGYALAPAIIGLAADWVTSGERPALLAPFAWP